MLPLEQQHHKNSVLNTNKLTVLEAAGGESKAILEVPSSEFGQLQTVSNNVLIHQHKMTAETKPAMQKAFNQTKGAPDHECSHS